MNVSARRQARVVILLLTVGVAAIAALTIRYWPIVALAFDGQRNGRVYWIPSRSMMPTLVVGDRILPRAPRADEPARGEVIVYRRTASEVRVARVAAIGGDRIEVRGGVPWINGVPARWRMLGAGPVLEGGLASRLYAEHQPGERGSHRILKTMTSPLDDFASIVVPQGKLFLLGDNRDQSADSRAPVSELGAGLVPVDHVLGIVDYIVWSAVEGRMARPIDHRDPIPSPEQARQ